FAPATRCLLDPPPRSCSSSHTSTRSSRYRGYRPSLKWGIAFTSFDVRDRTHRGVTFNSSASSFASSSLSASSVTPRSRGPHAEVGGLEPDLRRVLNETRHDPRPGR